MEIAIGFASLGFLVVTNLALAVYKFGRLEERVNSIKERQNHLGQKYDRLEERINRILEGLGKGN